MRLLRPVLYAQAALWMGFGLLIAVAPRWLLETVGGQPPLSDDAWARTTGVTAVILALFMVLVAQRLDEVWWWAWAFALLEIGTGAVFVFHALLSLPSEAAAWPWWLLGVANVAFAGVDLVGLGFTAQEKPFV